MPQALVSPHSPHLSIPVTSLRESENVYRIQNSAFPIKCYEASLDTIEQQKWKWKGQVLAQVLPISIASSKSV